MDCQDKTFLYQKLTLIIDSVRAGNIENQIQLVLFQHLPQDIGRLLNDLDITVLIHGIKAFQNRCQKPFTSVGTETQPDQCPGAGNDITKLPFQLGMRVESRNCPFIEKGACIGKLHLATVPFKKRDSGFFFQSLNA